MGEAQDIRQGAIKEMNLIADAFGLPHIKDLSKGVVANEILCPVAVTLQSLLDSVVRAETTQIIVRERDHAVKISEALHHGELRVEKQTHQGGDAYGVSIMGSHLADFIDAFDDRIYPELIAQEWVEGD